MPFRKSFKLHLGDDLRFNGKISTCIGRNTVLKSFLRLSVVGM